MNLPPNIEKELRRRWKNRGYSEVEILCLLEFYSVCSEIQKDLVKEKGFILKLEKAA